MYKLNLFKRNKKYLKSVMNFGRIIEREFAGNSGKFAIILNKDGSMQTTWRYRGPDLDSAVKEELSIITLRLQESFAMMKTGWCLYFEAQRSPSTTYPTMQYFPDPVTKGIDNERKRLFSSGSHFESDFYATLYWLPPSDNQEKIKAIMIEGKEQKLTNAEDNLHTFHEQVMKLYATFKSLQIPVEFLNADELLTYIHSTVSSNNHSIILPKKPLLLDQYLYDTPLYGGLEPKLGDMHLRIVSPIAYSKATVFGYFNVLNQLNFPYRWVTRCYCLSKEDVLSELTETRRKWKNKLQSIAAMFSNSQYDPSKNDPVVEDKVAAIEDAIAAVESDTLSYVYYTTAVIVMDKEAAEAENKAKLIRQSFINLGITAVIEDVNALDAYLGSIPGMVGHNIRRPMISTGNLIHLMPLSDIWAGHSWNKHLNAPPLLYTQTIGNTPFRLNLHIEDVGHSFVIGPTGAGKSVLLNCIEAAFRRYKDARVIIFDKGASSKVLTMGVGGQFYDLGREASGSKSLGLSFQPLANIDREEERQWAQEWLCDFLQEENLEITPEIKGYIRDALSTLSNSPKEFRTLSTFRDFLQNIKLQEAFAPLTLSDAKGNAGEYGHIFDSNQDNLEISRWQSFEMERLMGYKTIIGPTLMYIFHRIEESLTGEPTLIVLDECWVFFDNPMFADKIRSWLKVLRKYNASVVFATQSLEDITKSPLFDTILTNCHSRIFLPNTTALEEKQKETYESFGLNQRQIEIIATAVPKRQYYYDSQEGSRLFDLALEECPYTLAYVAVDKNTVKKCDDILERYGRTDFDRHWREYKEVSYPEDTSEQKGGVL